MFETLIGRGRERVKTEGRDRGFTYDAEFLLRQSSTVQLNDFQRNYRQFRLNVYNFLDHPLSSRSTSYHFGVFIFVLIAVLLGATTETIEDHWSMVLYSYMEKVLGVFFTIEFIVRMWAISADAKYMGWKGHMRYLINFVCLCDIVMIIVTIAMLLVEKDYLSSNTMAYLRFAQILRLFHVDRQMTTWRLIKDMVMISRMELFAAYYITFIVMLVLANIVFYTEFAYNGRNSTMDGTSETFPTMAHAWWYVIVSILTIGYGDIVPSSWLTKIFVCILGFVGYCTFVTASTQISVGLTLMMEEDNKKEYKNKLRNTAASVIQCWWRYHLATWLTRDLKKKTRFFKLVCYKLYLSEEKLKKLRQFEKKQKEKREKKRRFQVTKALLEKNQGTTVQTTSEWKQRLQLSVTTNIIHPMGIDSSAIQRTVPMLQRHMSLPTTAEIPSHHHTYAAPPTPPEPSRALHSRRHSEDTTISSSFDCSDSEQITAIMNEQHNSVDINDVDEKLLIKYQPLLRFFNFLLFREFTKKFQRMRKADKLLEIEAEITEQDHERDQKLKELENCVNYGIWRTVTSPLDPKGEKLNFNQRMELCETVMVGMQQKVDEIVSLTDSLSFLLNAGRVQPTGLPPLPPFKDKRGAGPKGRRLRRQSTISPTMEEEPISDIE